MLTAPTLPRRDPKSRPDEHVCSTVRRHPGPPEHGPGVGIVNDVAVRLTAALGPLILEQIHAGIVDGRPRRPITLTDLE